MLVYCTKCHENVELGEKMVSPSGEGGPAEYEPCCSECGSIEIEEMQIEEED